MNELILHKIKLAAGKEKLADWENFNEMVDIVLSDKSGKKLATYQLNVVSIKYLESQDRSGLYFRFCVVQEYFDLNLLEKHVKDILKECQFLPLDEALKRVGRFLFVEEE